MNCYTTVYDFDEFVNGIKLDYSVILDRAFLDFDAHDEPLENAYDDLKKVVSELIAQDTIFKMYFSGKGFHVFVYGEQVSDIRSIQQYYSQISDGVSTLDRTGIQTNRLRRIPNSMNLSSSDDNGNPYYCIPLIQEDLQEPLDYILELAKSPRNIQSSNGTKLVVFPEMKPIEISDEEVEIPTPIGRLPILPCLHNAITVENPSHYARVYLVQWYRDLLSLGNRNTTVEQNKQITDNIMEELETIASKEDIWLDWDSRTTTRYVKGIVDKGYNAPSCSNVLIPQGYCIGKCWRYYDGCS
tara:strand:+ start:449 stop:1345 length:897 start_codon:yes stop_codon:yes gene_type:complete